jgi:hypothetical protein
MILSAPKGAPSLQYVSRKELAGEFSISERAVDDLVNRGVFPNPSVQTPYGPKWSWGLIEKALALFDSPPGVARLSERGT